jgi:hypothetical protein
MPLFSQSPYRVGSGPFGPPDSLGAGLALASAACLRASASASARWAAGVSGLRSGEEAAVGREGSLSWQVSRVKLQDVALQMIP